MRSPSCSVAGIACGPESSCRNPRSKPAARPRSAISENLALVRIDDTDFRSSGRFLMLCVLADLYFTGKPHAGAIAEHRYLTVHTGNKSMTNRFGGRPRLPREQVRDKRVVTFLTGEERSFLEKLAGDANVSVSRACHDLIVRGMDQAKPLRSATKSTRRKKK